MKIGSNDAVLWCFVNNSPSWIYACTAYFFEIAPSYLLWFHLGSYTWWSEAVPWFIQTLMQSETPLFQPLGLFELSHSWLSCQCVLGKHWVGGNGILNGHGAFHVYKCLQVSACLPKKPCGNMGLKLWENQHFLQLLVLVSLMMQNTWG